MTIIDIPKQPSWVDRFSAMKIGQELNAPYEKKGTIQPILSRDRKLIGMKFETKKDFVKKGKRIVQVLNIKRVA